LRKYSVTLELSNSTPILVGWYKPDRTDPYVLRATEIKGLWRWWARAFIGGALYDLGYLNGISTQDILRKPSRREVRVITKIIGEKLGLGMAGEAESLASRFSIYTMLDRSPRSLRYAPSQPSDWQRVRLLTIRNPIEAYDRGGTYSLHIEWFDGSGWRPETALKILLVALQFSGVGKGSRRGLGSLDILRVDGLPFPIPRSVEQLIKEAYRECREIVEESRRELEGLERRDQNQLPPFPVVSGSQALGVKVTQMRIYQNVDLSTFTRIHNFFVRSERCRVLYGSLICNDPLRLNLLAWFLGLPREQRGTGYKIKASGVHRRASPIHLAFHTGTNMFGGGAYLAVFLSADWPKELEWTDGPGVTRSLTISYSDIVSAYHTFSMEFDNYLRGIGVSKVVQVW